MAVTKKTLIVAGCTALALFIVANPLGDSQHGLGKHNAFLADLGQTVWVAFLVSAVIFILLGVVAVYHRLRPARQTRA